MNNVRYAFISHEVKTKYYEYSYDGPDGRVYEINTQLNVANSTVPCMMFQVSGSIQYKHLDYDKYLYNLYTYTYILFLLISGDPSCNHLLYFFGTPTLLNKLT